uniref:Peptidase M28 domain-containing protein n=1 Tax=Plectus sambesii TaxID=2011161 RepID=A0A914VRS2_9BILA
MPAGGAQRGSILDVDGDPLTPLYPSKSYTYRLAQEDVTNGMSVPVIPVMPIGYRDAANLFLNMDGLPVPPDWQGGISSVNYTFTSSKIFQVTVHATQPQRKIRNVIAVMPGTTEPDKYVLLINHVDAWTYGAMDPNSGTVALLETARALSAVANATGWRPRRTIVFCSVDAEEFGLIGSTEFAEEYLKVLQQRAVALINVDVGVKGHVTLLATATPSLYQTLIRAAKTVPNPNQGEVALGRATVYDSWIYYFPNDSFVPGQPRMRVPDSGSDQSTFLSFVGVPSAYLTYFCDPTIKRDCYELYHTMFEVPWTIETYIDPGYKALTAMTQLWTEIARDLSDTLVIPFDVNDYATVLSLAVKQLNVYLNSKIIPSIITTYPMIMSNLFNSSDRFTTVANNLQLVVDGINSGKKSASLRQVEMINSRLMGLERTFINDRGLYPQREAARHVLFATSIHDHYSGTMGAGVYDSVEYYLAAVQNNDVTQQKFWLQRIEITISELQYGVESAILLMDIADY